MRHNKARITPPRDRRRGGVWIATLLVSGSVAIRAGEAAASDGAGQMPDKSRFNLFNPTPEKDLRELSPDRPDQTESPITVRF